MSEALFLDDPGYPKLLKSIPRPPQALFFKGSLGISVGVSIFNNCVGIVGSRRMTSYGRKAAQYFAEELSSWGVTVVSGFMYGIDSVAHSSCLSAGGRTIGVLPYGIDYPCPLYQKDLYEQIIGSGGLMVSEYEGETPPALWTFPKRNRLIAGLCRALVVVEAGEKSGSLITADYANSYSRKVFAVPGSVFSDNSAGILTLLKDRKAEIATVTGIMNYLGIDYVHNNKEIISSSDKSEQVNLIFGSLKSRGYSFDELLSITKLKYDVLSNLLVQEQLKGRIISEGGVYHVSKN